MNIATRGQRPVLNAGNTNNQRPDTSPRNGVKEEDARLTGSTAEQAGPRKKAPARVRKYSDEEIALRAYFIAEKRQQLGLPGSADADWMEAERQLVSEPRANPRKKKI